MAIRMLALTAQVSPPKPTREALLLNTAMKAVLVVALSALVSMVIIFAYTAEWHKPGSDDRPLSEPNVQLANAESWGGNQWSVDVTGVSEAKELEHWTAILLKNGALHDEMDPLASGFSDYTFFVDLTGDGKLTAGDYFIITCDEGSTYQLSIIWRESGNVKGSEEWST